MKLQASRRIEMFHAARFLVPVALVFLKVLCACELTHSSAAAAEPRWELVTSKAGWAPRDSAGEVVFGDHLWIMGGWFNSFEAPPRDVWKSRVGKLWTQVGDAAPWISSDLAMTMAFRNRMWLLGGWYNGRLQGCRSSSEVWSSADGETWELETAVPGWTPRLASGVVEFQGKLWILGGVENYYFGDQSSLKNDVWASADGKTWTKVIENAPWSARAYHQAVVLGDKMYVLGGGNYVPRGEARNDVWASADGVHWECVVDHAPWPPRIWFSAATYRNRIWILGGWSADPKRNWGDVWHSADGRNWEQLASVGPHWKDRHEHSVFVFHDKLWVVGGHADPLNCEVWSLSLPSDWPVRDERKSQQGQSAER